MHGVCIVLLGHIFLCLHILVLHHSWGDPPTAIQEGPRHLNPQSYLLFKVRGLNHHSKRVTWVIKCPHFSHHPTKIGIWSMPWLLFTVMSNIPKMGQANQPPKCNPNVIFKKMIVFTGDHNQKITITRRLWSWLMCLSWLPITVNHWQSTKNKTLVGDL